MLFRSVMKLILALIGLVLMSATAQAQVNKCVDASGKTVYLQGPCPKGAKSSAVAVEKSAPVAAAKDGGAAEDGGAAKSTGPKTTAELEQDFRKRQQEQADAQKKEAEKLAAAKASQENCDAARRQVASYNLGGRQSSIDDKGERVFLDDSQVAQARARAEKAVSDFCK